FHCRALGSTCAFGGERTPFARASCGTTISKTMSDAAKTAPKVPGKPFKAGEAWNGNAAGRPKGSRNKLGEEFVAALHDSFLVHGKETIEKVREDKPDVYLKVIAQ